MPYIAKIGTGTRYQIGTRNANKPHLGDTRHTNNPIKRNIIPLKMSQVSSNR